MLVWNFRRSLLRPRPAAASWNCRAKSCSPGCRNAASRRCAQAAAPLGRRRPGHVLRADDRPAARPARAARRRVRAARHDGRPPSVVQRRHAQAAAAAARRPTDRVRAAPGGDRRTACISTQVGCGMGCVFCASGIDGVVRNLTPAEILEQLLHARNLLPADERLTHIVVMGMGEPLANLDDLLEALDVADAAGRPGHRRPAHHHLDRRPAGQDPPPRRPGQAVSPGRVAARSQRRAAQPDRADQRQDRPRRHPGGGRLFLRDDGRQVTYEYVLLRDLNDRPAHAARAGPAAARPAGARQPDPVQRRGGAAVPPADAGGADGFHRRSCSSAASASRCASARGRRSTRPAASCGVRRWTRPAHRRRSRASGDGMRAPRRNPFPPAGFNGRRRRRPIPADVRLPWQRPARPAHNWPSATRTSA